MDELTIRRWRSDDLARLVEVSQAADRLFTDDAGLDLPPDDPTAELRHAEHVLVAGSPAVGFAVVNTVDGRAHLATLGVHPSHGRRGIGGRLLTAACSLGAEMERSAITLTTFVDVPWNAPWYAARGFAVLPAGEWGPQLRAVWAAEQAAGIVVAPRTAMIRPLTR
ncbi:MAG TPA: GNAT family N-acetyltransferase [Pseudonocardiaceae bacterium]|nr:GNAT family N-acetyltransferase [Pseudonocardiaceae bacterium]